MVDEKLIFLGTAVERRSSKGLDHESDKRHDRGPDRQPAGIAIRAERPIAIAFPMSHAVTSAPTA